MNDEEGRIISRSKELLGKDRLDALEGRGRNSRIQEEVRATENALKALQNSLHGPTDSRWQKRSFEIGESAGLVSPPALRSPRSIVRDLIDVKRGGSGEQIREGNISSIDSPHSHLSKEAQIRIAQICVIHGAVPEEKPATVSVDGSEPIQIWASRPKSGSVDLNKAPFPELQSASVSERRELAPYISTIYDQIFLDPNEETAVLLNQPTTIDKEPSKAARPSMFYGRNDAPISIRAPPQWRSEEGFWVDFKSVDLGAPSDVRGGVVRDSIPTYGSVEVKRPDDQGFMSRNMERLKVFALALAVVICCYVMWRFLVGLSDSESISGFRPDSQ